MRPNVAVYVGGHGVQYLGLIAMGATGNPGLRYLTLGGLALQAAGAIGGVTWRSTARGKVLALAVLGWIIAQGVAGYTHVDAGESWSSYYAADCVIFSAVLGVFMGDELHRVARLYAWLLPLGLVVAVSLVAKLGAAGYGERFVSDVDGAEAAATGLEVLAAQLCTPALWLMLVGRDSRPVRVMALGGVVVMALFGLVTGTRWIAIAPLFALAARLAFLPNRRRWALALVLVVGVATAAAVARWGGDGLEDSADSLAARFFDEDDFSTGRNEEAAVFLDVLSEGDLAVGRGLGGSYVGMFIASSWGINMVHYGALHLVLKGGFVLAGLFALLMLQAVVAGVRRGGPALGCALFVLVFAAVNVGHTQFSIDPGFALAMLSMGAARLGVVAARAPVAALPRPTWFTEAPLRARVVRAVREWREREPA